MLTSMRMMTLKVTSLVKETYYYFYSLKKAASSFGLAAFLYLVHML